MRAVCQAVLLALEHGRLESELAATHARIVTAGDAERRKVERDLHDGAQQSLVALQIKLALAQELAPSDSEIAARLAEVGYGLEDAVQELREPRPRHPPSDAARLRAARGARFRHAALEAADGA